MKGVNLQDGTISNAGGKEGWEKCSNHHKSHKKREVELLCEMLDEVKTDRDSWREQANKITTLIEDQSANSKGFWARLRG